MPDMIGTEAGEALTSDGSVVTVYGLGGDDLLFGISPYSLGWSGNSTLVGGVGNDILISGGAGAGQLLGGDGDDYIADGMGNATLGDPLSISITHHIKAGGHFIDGGSGNDTAYVLLNGYFVDYGAFYPSVHFDNSNAAAQNVITVGGVSNGVITNVENVWIVGGFGDDVLTGGAGNDAMIGDLGDDILSGAAGDDVLGGRNAGIRSADPTRFFSLSGFDTLDGGDGVDIGLIAPGAGSVAITFDNSNPDAVNGVYVDGVLRSTVTKVERIMFSSGDGNDQLTVGDLDDALYGSAGNDILNAGGGDDVLDGGDGDDILNAGAGVDTVFYTNATAGVIVSLAVAGPQNTGGAGNDTLIGVENVTGSARNDVLTGDGGDNILRGLASADLLWATGGHDILDGGTQDTGDVADHADTVSFANITAGVVISLAETAAQAIADGSVTLIDIENLIGSAFDDTLTGNSGDNSFDGGLGDDVILGGGGFDAASYAAAAAGVTLDLRTTAAQSTPMGADTLVSIEALVGSAFDDVLTGDNGANTLRGGAGNDRLDGRDGTNTLDGGDGDDFLLAGLGTNHIGGGAGFDTASYERATAGIAVNMIYGRGPDSDTLAVENLIASAFNDTITGDGSSNLIQAGDGDDTVDGDWGDDTLEGGAGDDILKGNVGNDRIDGGGGIDTASYYNAQGPLRISLALAGPQDTGAGGVDTLVSVENISASFYADVLTGNDGDNIIFGDGGDDVITGGGGNDTLNGDAGFDTVDYSAAAGGIAVDLGLATAQDFGAAGVDTLISIEAVIGTAFDDTFIGTDDWNTFEGGGGDDTLIGGGGAGVDRASYATATAGVTVNLGLEGPQAVGGGMGADTLVGIEGVIGGAFADVLIGDAANNRLAGGGGDDIIEGGAGDDILDGGAGIDTVSYASAAAGVAVFLSLTGSRNTVGAGNDSLSDFENLIGSAFNDNLAGTNADNILVGGLGNDTLDGSGGEDQLYGGAGNDTLRSGNESTNRDFLYGGAGNDAYYVTSSLTGPLDLVYEGGSDPELMAGANDIDVIRSSGNFFWDYYSVGERLYISVGAGSQLVGGTNNQEIFGGAGSDQIIAYGGSNRVDAGGGTDAISFGLYGLDESYDGVNTLVMKAGNGLDYVYEFESGVDKIDLTAFNFGITGQQVLDQAVNVDQAGTADDYCYFYLTSAGGVDNYVAFIGLLSSQLQAGDFIT